MSGWGHVWTAPDWFAADCIVRMAGFELRVTNVTECEEATPPGRRCREKCGCYLALVSSRASSESG